MIAIVIVDARDYTRVMRTCFLSLCLFLAVGHAALEIDSGALAAVLENGRTLCESLQHTTDSWHESTIGCQKIVFELRFRAKEGKGMLLR